MSGRQCQIVPEATTKSLHLEVLDAAHATSIDGQRLGSGERKKLENGDIVAVGTRRFKIMYSEQTRDMKVTILGKFTVRRGQVSSKSDKIMNHAVIACDSRCEHHQNMMNGMSFLLQSRTPGRTGATPGSQSAQKKRKSIFDSTPPVPSKTPVTPQKDSRNGQVTSTSTFATGTPKTPPRLPRTSPRQPKSILSAKKNILVTRTPTMSPKVVRWGSPK